MPAPAAPYRTPSPTPGSLGWAVEPVPPRTTIFARDHGPQGLFAAGASTVPLLVYARLTAGGLGAMSIAGWIVAVLFAVGVIALWPRSRETIRISPEGVVWRDRVAFARARFALDAVRAERLPDPRGAAVILADGEVRYLVARGAIADVEELARSIDRALLDARAPLAAPAR